MKFHEAANIFPLDETRIEDLAEDIKKHGLLCPIEIMCGKILDGRRRWSACQKAKVEPETVEVNPEDPVAYVLSLNLERRHLTPSQRSMCAARATSLREKYEADARERRERKPKSVRANLPEQRARDSLGKAFGVSGRSVGYAEKVEEKGTPSLKRAVNEGRMAVSTAAILSSESPEAQDAEANKPKRRRKYQSVSLPPPVVEEDDAKEGESRGVGVLRANEAIDCLSRIPKNDALRKRGFQIVTDWIRHNK